MTGPTLFAGDPHSKHAHIVRAANELEASAVILLGDMQAKRPLAEELAGLRAGCEWFFVPGNHDGDTEAYASQVFDPAIQHRNLHGRVVQLPDGRTAAGLGGIFRGVIWYPRDDPSMATEVHFRNRAELAAKTPRQARWRGGPHYRQWVSIYPDELNSLSELKAEILVTHESASYRGTTGFSILDTLAESMGVRLHVNGHHHDAWQVRAPGGHLCVSVGLRGITAVDTDNRVTIVLPGELDAQREFRKEQEKLFRGTT